MRLLAALSLCAIAPIMLANAEGTPAEVKSDDDKVVCTSRSEPVVGSNMRGKRVCMTKREWKEMESQAQRNWTKNRDRWVDSGRGDSPR